MIKEQGNDDPRALVEDAWRQVFATDADRHSDRLAPGAPRFIDYAWATFDPAKVMSILVSEEPTYPALKPILFSGLCTWVVCPAKNSLRQHGMLLVGMEHLRQAEARGQKLFAGRDLPGHELLGDMFGRVRMLGQEFFSDFYYPVKGMAQLLRSTTPGNFRRSLTKHTKDVPIIVAMMQIYDFHAKHLNDEKRFYKASDSKGYELIRKIHGNGRKVIGIDLGKMETTWKALGAYAALIYAASTLPTSEGRSLFETIRNGTANYEDHGHLLRRWFGRTRYAAETMLSNSTKPELGPANADRLPALPSEPTPEPHFNETERTRIESEFDMTAILGNRQRDQRRERLSRRGPRKV